MDRSRMVVAALIGCCLVCTARADVVVSNLDEPERDKNVLSTTDWAAQAFVTGPNRYFLTSVEAITGNSGDLVDGFAQLRASDADGAMDTSEAGLLATFALPDLSGPLSAQMFLPDVTVELARGTQYYFVLGVSGGGTFEWSYAEGNGQTGPGSLAQYEYTFDGGATWGTFGSDNPFHIAVNGDLVPCPADFNADGFLTFEDFDAFVAAFEAGENNADFDGNGFLTFEDFDAFVTAFEAGC